MESNLLKEDVKDILYTALAKTDGDLLLVNPSETVIENLVEVASSFDGTLPTIRMLADQGLLKDAMDDFLLGSRAADLIDAEQLYIRELDESVSNSLIISDNTVSALVPANNRVGALSTTDPEFVKSAQETYDADWDASETYNLRTPPISRVRSTLADEIGEDVRDVFDAILAELQSARGDGDGLDEVTVSLLSAAKGEALLYDISKWGEDVGIASKATFSRTKTRLEDSGLIETEKVPIDVGRPRLRLKLGDDRLRAAASDELATIAQDISG